MLPLTIDDRHYAPSRLQLATKLRQYIRLIFSSKNSRNLLGFLLLNLSFAFIELFYGVITNSLGLISDSFHMFFDCTGLLAGLVASVITKWAPNDRYSYGYVRAEILTGFINGLFLLFIAFFIFSEAIERAFAPPEIQHDRLLVVSVLGLLVNLVGIFVFQHGGSSHGHSHGGSSHGHSHGGSSHGHSHGGSSHGHSHGGSSNGHAHGDLAHCSHDRQIMRGVYLHILADTLGSVGVIVSALLMTQFGWMIADPICSMLISITIAVSVVSLFTESFAILMQRQPFQLDHYLPACYNRLLHIEGVLTFRRPHFWTLCTDTYVGSLVVEVAPHSDIIYIQSAIRAIFESVGVSELYIQIEFPAMLDHFVLSKRE